VSELCGKSKDKANNISSFKVISKAQKRKEDHKRTEMFWPKENIVFFSARKQNENQ
jgi:hypothetical protein